MGFEIQPGVRHTSWGEKCTKGKVEVNRRAGKGELDTAQRTACIAHSPLVCKRSNEMDRRRACIGQLDTVHGTVALRIHRWTAREVMR